MSKKAWDKLNKDEQAVVMDAARETATYQRKFSRDSQDSALVSLRKSMDVSVLPPAEISKVRVKVKPVIDKFSASIGPDFVKSVFAELEKIRK